MPVEIRELVIQAQLDDDKGKEDLEDEVEEMMPKEKEGDWTIEELQEMIETEVYCSFTTMKQEILKEMKIWTEEYLNNKRQSF